MDKDFTISRYILQRFQETGIKHLFGVPGDYVLDFMDEIVASDIKWVGSCNELNAGYSADGYARMNGIGAAVVTYGVGSMSIMNAVAGAYAEQIPVIIINGAPPARRREAGAMVHHLISDYYLQLEMYRKITCDAVILTDPETAPDEIDRVFRNCLLRKLPGYIELPSDMMKTACRKPGEMVFGTPLKSNEENLADCISEALEKFNKAERPIILAGIELLRYGLGAEALRLVEASEVPFATMLSSKSVLPELHPQFVGMYHGGWSRDVVKQQVEGSDCLLSLGVWITDLDTGLFSMNFDNRKMITAGGGRVRIGNHFYEQIQLGDFIRGLLKGIQPRSYLQSHPVETHQKKKPFVPESNCTLTAKRLYECLNYYLTDEMVMLSEPGDSFCAAPAFHIEEAENFIVQSYYCSIGFCTPAALGVSLARPEKRPVVLSGDGAFQMTAQEISTMIRQGVPAIIVIVNNDGYLIERMLHQDGYYNDIQMWKYSQLPSVFDQQERSLGFRAINEEELNKAVKTAVQENDKLVLIEACLPNRDCSTGLERLGKSFKEAQQKK